MKYSYKLLLVIVISIINQSLVLAQKDDRLNVDDLQSIESQNLINKEISVASKNAENLKDAPGAVAVITSTEIEKFGANNLLEVIERVASIYHVGSYFAPNNVISVRGDLPATPYNNHVLILINGRPTRENLFGGIDYPIFLSLPLSNIEAVEIIRGPGSVLYGTNAYSGVINIITKQVLDDETHFSLNAGSFDTYSFEAFNSKVKENLQVTSAVKYFHQGGWRNEIIGEDSTSFNWDAGQDNLGGMLTLNYKELEFNALVAYSAQDHTGVLPIEEYPGPIGAEQDFRNRRIETIRTFFDLGYDFEFSKKFELSLNGTFNAMNTRFSTPNGDFVAKTRDILIEPTAFYSITNRVKFILGATAYLQEGVAEIGDDDGRGVSEYDELWYSGYGQLEIEILKNKGNGGEDENNIKLLAGGQYNKPNGVDGDFVPRVGLVATYKRKFGFKLLYSQAFRAAFEAENNLRDVPVLAGKPDLRPEKVTTFDAQVSYNTNRFQFIATYFNSSQNDLISQEGTTVIDGLTTTTYINGNKLTISGLELETKIVLTKNKTNNNFFITASGTYQNNAKNDTIKNATLVPQTMIKLGAFYDWVDKGISLGVFNSYFSNAGNIDVPDTRRNPNPDAFSFMTAKLNIDLFKLFKKGIKKQKSYDKSNQINLSVYATNLLNQRIYYPEFVRGVINTMPGRSERAIFTNLSFKF